jgi:addiction module RelB/DinJ family antitoxin
MSETSKIAEKKAGETRQVRLRINRQLEQDAKAVFASLGTDASHAVSMFFAQVVRERALPFRPSEYPALDAYGVTIADAAAAEDAALADIQKQRRAGKVTEFKGKL